VSFILSDEQKTYIDAMQNNDRILLYGGRGLGGKTSTTLFYFLNVIMQYKNVNAAFVRANFNMLSKSMFEPAMYIAKQLGFDKALYFTSGNMSTIVAKHTNSSIIGISMDKDTKDRTIQGANMTLIFADEADNISYKLWTANELVLRLPAKHIKLDRTITPKLIACINPPSKSNYLYKLFIEHKYPDTFEDINDGLKYAAVKTSLSGNPSLSDTYKNMLSKLRGNDYNKFYLGEFSDDGDFSLFDIELITYCLITEDTVKSRHSYKQIIISIDPAADDVKSDNKGLNVSAITADNSIIVLGDYSNVYPNEKLLEMIAALYETYSATYNTVVLVEKNGIGGLMKDLIRNRIPTVTVKEYHRYKGKVEHAALLSRLMRCGTVKILDTAPINVLKTEMLNFSEGNKSPGAIDALANIAGYKIGFTKSSLTSTVITRR